MTHRPRSGCFRCWKQFGDPQKSDRNQLFFFSIFFFLFCTILVWKSVIWRKNYARLFSVTHFDNWISCQLVSPAWKKNKTISWIWHGFFYIVSWMNYCISEIEKKVSCFFYPSFHSHWPLSFRQKLIWYFGFLNSKITSNWGLQNLKMALDLLSLFYTCFAILQLPVINI